MSTLTIYSYLFAATALYAVILAHFRRLWEPDLTWLEVVVGTALCLTAPYVDQRYNGPLTSELYEQRVWIAFLVGGTPIVAWQLGQSVRARLRVERLLGNHGNTSDHTAPLAAERRTEPPAGD
jgi:hypothetical protein